ncbi:MAG TPA: DUF3011 domain-containing protein [Terriglobales bacterium]|nr:DUF3011 domain-containing protein [Terriglobales bacterium]
MKRLGIVLLLLLIALPVFARSGPKRGELVRADYGWGDTWVDVTERVRSLIRGQSLNFRADNATLGVDPRPGKDQALRLHLRDKQGRTRVVTFHENENVRLQPVWSAAVSSAGLQILRGTYGAGNRTMDVTDRLRRQIQNGQLNLQVTNNAMGGDPAENQAKTLTVQHSFNGRTGQVVINEGDYLRLPDTSYEGSLQILRGTYGAGNRTMDVTDRLRRQIQNGQLNLQVTNSAMGGDPAEGQYKTLTVQHSFNGWTGQVVINEGDYLRLPDSYQGSLQILRGTYGAGNRTMDVTDRLRRQIQNGQLNLQVTNNAMGGDPAENQAKTLTVQHSFNGRTGQVVINEGDYLRLPDNSYQGSLQILRGTYGAGNRTMDVTDRLRRQIQNGQLNLQVTNNAMGGDPAEGQDKTLTVQHSFNGQPGRIVINEGDYLRLPDSYQGSLQILRGTYGAGNRTMDVTDRLRRQIQNGQLNLQVTNNAMGGDPAEGQNKTLTVQHSFNGRTGQVVINESDYLYLPVQNATSTSQYIRCESGNNERRYCRIDSRGGVRLSRQLSDARCTQGSTWGYDSEGVWVDNGCRAEFEVSSLLGSNVGSGGAYTTIPSGTQLAIRTNEVIDSKTANVGQTFSAVMDKDVLDGAGTVTIRKGSDVDLVIRSTAGSDLVLDIDSLTVGGNRYFVSTGDLERSGRDGLGANKRTAVLVGGGAAVGAIIGAIVSGGKGAAIGAGIGAAGGVAGQVLTGGKEVRVPAETLLSFKLDQDLRLQP